jgi:hypothetical protein
MGGNIWGFFLAHFDLFFLLATWCGDHLILFGTIPTPLPLTPEQLDFDDRVEAAIAKSSALIAEAKAQLAAPEVAPEELTKEEDEGARRNRACDLQYQQENQAIDEAMERNQALFKNVMATVDDMEANGVPIPDCSDLDFSWKSNAGFAGLPSKTSK